MVNPFAAASAVDVVTRLVAQGLTQTTGKSFLVENKTGASGNIGTEFVAKAKPDGYTFLVGSPGTMAINPYLFKKLPYDAEKDFIPVTTLVSFPQVLIVNPNAAGEDHGGADGVREGARRQAQLFLGRHRHHLAPGDGAGEGGGRPGHGARAVPRRRAGDPGGDRRRRAVRGGRPASLPAHLKAGTVRAVAVTSLQRAAVAAERAGDLGDHPRLRRRGVGHPVRAGRHAGADRRAHGGGGAQGDAGAPR